MKAPSALLTASYKRPTTINAAILLPKEYYDQPERKFPVLYWISDTVVIIIIIPARMTLLYR
jgi:hypothetical protein